MHGPIRQQQHKDMLKPQKQPHVTTGKATTLVPVMYNQRDFGHAHSRSKTLLNLIGWLVEVQLCFLVDDSSLKLLLSGSTSWDQQGPLLVFRWKHYQWW